ncbi:MAG: hypothetical protein ACRDJ3_03370 [Solirubrobacteraceae bacterium]
MSVSTEVQRTLVKSPPELWAELSSPEALARHLGEFGDIKITSVEPETKVEWEAGTASGVVHLKQSGWGTKVTLSVTRNPSAPEEPAEPLAVVEPIVEPEPTPEPEPALIAEPETATTVEPEPVADPEPQPTPEPVAVVEPEPKLGFFARLFHKRKAKQIAVIGHEAEVEADPQPEVVAMAAPEPIYPEPPPEPVVDLAAELASVEAQMAEETTELLTGVLDRLGAAHHRPFSRG